MGSQSKSSQTKANRTKANGKTSKVAKSANREQRAKHSRWWMVAASIVALVVIVAIVIIAIMAIRGASPRNNFTVEKFNGQTYYVMHGIYDGDYDVQYTDLSLDFDEESGNDDEWRNFDTQAIMDYGEYVDFCNRWHLNRKYSNKGMRYMVVSHATPSAVSVDAALAGVEYDGNTANLYVWDDSYGVTANKAAYVIVVPTDNEHVKNIDVVETLNEDDWQATIDPDSAPEELPVITKKPIIYLYPQVNTDVVVKLGKPEGVLVSYPTYNAQTGWHVLAKPSGELVDLQDGRSLYALYYEGKAFEAAFKVEDDGFVVKREDTTDFLEDKLARLGLNGREAEEFFVYWLPKLNEHEYNYIRFANADEINQVMPLDINPQPDTVIRVMMTYKGLDEPIDVAEQQLPKTPVRNGFTAVEWGGSKIVD